jgi:hypothetical protein
MYGGVALLVVIFAIAAYMQMHVPPQQASLGTDAPYVTSAATGKPVPQPLIPGVTTTAIPPREAPDGAKEYHNYTYHFSLFYPDTMTVQEYKEKGTALTVVFQSTIDDKTFQIYIQPYGETQVTPARFKLDEPSGMMASSTDTTVDGVPAKAFYSADASLGATREVWFIRGGFLYELTTYSALDTWLDGLLSTWQFL